MVGIFAFSHPKLFVFVSVDTRNRKEWHVNKTGRKLIKISTCQKKKKETEKQNDNQWIHAEPHAENAIYRFEEKKEKKERNNKTLTTEGDT